MNRRELLQASVAGAVSLSVPAASAAAAVPPFAYAGKSVRALQEAMTKGTLTAEALTKACLARIEALNAKGPTLRAVIETNRDALKIAKALDAERKAKGARGPLHGIPVLVKDNIDTGDYQQTTAGSLMLVGVMTKRDATVVRRLREAGAVILGKANLSEWANIRSTRSTSGWSARGGQCKNPHALDRSPIGSSSGSAAGVAAELAPLAVGTETDGSIVCPSSACGVVGLKPTVGLVSRTGIIPISSTQDTAGPIAKSVEDAALLLDALRGEDRTDAATAASAGKAPASYVEGLSAKGLEGVRFGVVRNLEGVIPAAKQVFAQALVDLKRLGVELVDPVELPMPKEFLEAELLVMLTELKAGLDAYLLERCGRDSGKASLADLVAWNQKHADAELPAFGQELFERALTLGPVTSKAYLDAKALCAKVARTDGIDAALAKHHLDGFVTPSIDPAWLVDPVFGDPPCAAGSTPAAAAGYPSLSVPMGDVFGLPVGLLFFGPAWSEARLLRWGYAFEQGTKHLRAPGFAPTVTP